MSCHTQSGVWGPAVPIAFGYRVENVGNYRHLMNMMYESLRPTTRSRTRPTTPACRRTTWVMDQPGRAWRATMCAPSRP